jgi:DNA-binding CsgD family transcriptional regulator
MVAVSSPPRPDGFADLMTPPAVDLVTAGKAILELIAALQGGGPLAIVVDDAQWADGPSLSALVFALRHLRADHVLAIFSAREDDDSRLPNSLHRLVDSDGGTRLRLAGLGVPELRHLAASLGRGVISLQSAQRLRDHTGGNPLYAWAVLEELPAMVTLDAAVPLPCPRSFGLLVLARLADCPPEAQRLVLAAAVLSTPCPLPLAGRLAAVDDPLLALEEAVAARLLVAREATGEWTVDFPHPLVRAAVYHDLGPARRSALHSRAADLVGDPAASLRHRVAGTPGQDAALADEATRLALRQTDEDAWAAAVRSFLAAARLVTTPTRHQQLLLRAIDCMLLAGEAGLAAEFTATLAGFPDSPRRRYVLGRMASMAGKHTEAAELLQGAWERSDDVAEAGFRVQVAELLALTHVLQGRGWEGTEWGRRALIDEAGGARAASFAMTPFLISLGLSGRMSEALDMCGALAPLSSTGRPHEVAAALARGALHLWSDDPVAARQELSVVVSAPWRGPLHYRLLGLACLTEAEDRLGAWDDALLHAEMGACAARDAEQNWILPRLHAAAASVCAGRGEWAVAEVHVRAATEALAAGDEFGMVSVSFADAVLAFARGRPESVVAALDGFLRLDHFGGGGVDAPEIVPWRPLLADALVALGRWDEADVVLSSLEASAAPWGWRSSALRAARVRGRLEAGRGRREEAEQAFLTGLAIDDHSRRPLDRALLENAYGGFLRRLGQRRAAAEWLEAARHRFAALGARPFLEHCEWELTACGLRPARRFQRDPAELTPQELTVARLVSGGLTNREVARELVVSTKTVEFHLANVFAKFGITARAQIASRLPEEPSATAS